MRLVRYGSTGCISRPDDRSDRSVPLDDTWRRSVVFILDRMDGDPIGTGFLLFVENEFQDGLNHAYVVTAAHLVMGLPHTPAMRLRQTDGETTIDVPLGPWEISEVDDVAAQETNFFDIDPPVMFNAYPLHQAIDVEPFDVPLRSGERCYFIGLLERIPQMGRSMIPMVRSGTLGAYAQENVPISID